MAQLPLRIVFAGTPDFAVPCLQALLNSSHQILAVYTQPDRSAGRGRALAMSPVKSLALAHNIQVIQPETLRDQQVQQQFQAWQADVMIVIAYGLLLPLAILQAPRFGCINVHASLLPRWRGAAPIQRAILAGDPVTGVTIMQMDVGLDTGAMLKKVECVIEPTDTAKSLQERLMHLAPEALLSILSKLSSNELQAVAQDHTLATYANKLSKQEGLIDWSEPAEIIERKIRAFNPWPMAYTIIQQQPLRILSAQLLATQHAAAPGTIVEASAAGIDVATGDQVLRIQQLQFAGGKPLKVKECLNARAALFAKDRVLG